MKAVNSENNSVSSSCLVSQTLFSAKANYKEFEIVILNCSMVSSNLFAQRKHALVFAAIFSSCYHEAI